MSLRFSRLQSGKFTNFTNGLKGSTISATTYFNLPTKIEFVTGSSQLTDLVNSSGLTVGNRYVLNDYKTIYQINGYKLK
jgi:hypothetical protein